MEHQRIDDIVDRIRTVEVGRSVIAAGDALLVCSGFDAVETLTVRTATTARRYRAGGRGVTRALGVVRDAPVVELAVACDRSVAPLPDCAPRIPLAPHDVACVVGGRVVVVGPDAVTVYDPRTYRPLWMKWVGEDAAPVATELVAARGGDGIGWVTGRDGRYELLTVTLATRAVERHALPPMGIPSHVAFSPSGSRAAVVAGGSLHHVDPAGRGQSVGAAVTGNVLWTDDRCVAWVSRNWPASVVHQLDVVAGIHRHQVLTGWDVSQLCHLDGEMLALSSAAERPPAVRPVRELAAGQPAGAAYEEVEVDGGRLRAIVHTPPELTPRGLVVLLRGTPFGEWRPRWDPVVETVVASGFVAVQLESPYTAAVLGRLPVLHRGEFGQRDARLVAAATQHLRARLGLAGGRLAFIGHSYGAYLAARTQDQLPAPADGLLLMHGPWTTADLLRMADERGPTALQRFVGQAFAHDQGQARPERETARLPRLWHVILGTDDHVGGATILEAAVGRDRPAAVTRLAGEGHDARRRESMEMTVRAVHAWLGQVAGG